jgi:hypothetical protein
MKITVFTICSANYLPYARVLHRSLGRNSAIRDFVCFLVDEVNGRFSTEDLPFDCVEARTIGCGNFFDMAARYSIIEMNTAIKPYCFKWLLKNKNSDNIVYLDPDIYVLSEFLELNELLCADADIVLTPHSTQPLLDGKDPDDHRLLRTGVYNLGFCAVRRSSSASAFLDWWHEHLIENCTIEIENGIFVDQKYCDLVPSYFDNVKVLRHPGYNVAYWNLLHRKVIKTEENNEWLVNALPLRFFHFSGIVPSDNTVFSKHQDRFFLHNIGDVKELLTVYICELRELSRLSNIDLFSLGYSYAELPGGIPFTKDLRAVYRELLKPNQRSFDEAFSGNFGRYLTLSPDVIQDESAPITRLAYAIWKSRRDLRETFALGSFEGRSAFFSWFLTTATREHKVSPSIVNATRALADPDPTIANNRVAIRYDATTSNDQRNLTAYFDWAAPRRINPDIAIGLSLFGYFRSENGLGAAVRANLRAAQSVGINVTAHDVPSVGFERRVDPNFPMSDDPPPYDCLLLHVNADQISKLETYVDPRRLRGRHRIGYWAWELGAMPLEWVGAYKRVDEIWTPSQFAANAFKQRTTKPVSVIHHPVEVPPPRKDTDSLRAKFGLPADRFVFLTAFDLNSYIDRKNPDGVVAAFKNAFVKNDTNAPILAVKFHGNYHRNSRFGKFLETVSSDSRIILIDKVLTVQEIGELQWCCDAFISLHRSEGFGLWIAECMARAKPCIVTNYSGNVDFTNATNSLPVGYSMVPVRRGEYPFGEGQWWAEPALDEAVSALRAVVESTSLRAEVGTAARQHVIRHLSYPLIGSIMENRLFAARSEIIDLPELSVEGV